MTRSRINNHSNILLERKKDGVKGSGPEVRQDQPFLNQHQERPGKDHQDGAECGRQEEGPRQDSQALEDHNGNMKSGEY